MSNIFSEIFKNEKDHYNWDNQIEYVKLTSIVTDTLRKEWLESLKFLQDELGKGFLKSCDSYHPIKKMILIKASWQVKELINFANTLRKLKSGKNSNYSKLLKKLLPTDICRKEGIPFMEIAATLLKEGCKVSFPEEIELQKNPDIEIINPENNEKVFIEVSKLFENKGNRPIRKNSETLSHQFHFTAPLLPFCCKQLEFISDKEMPAVLQKIQEIKVETNNKKTFNYYKDKKIELAIAHNSKQEKLDSWCKENNERYQDLISLSLDFNETIRILSNKKIKEEAVQLRGQTGLIYIPINPLYFWQTGLLDAAEKFQKPINKFPNLIGLVLYSNIVFEGDDFEFYEETNFHGIKTINENVTRELFFIYNHEFNQDLSDNTFNKIYNSFR